MSGKEIRTNLVGGAVSGATIAIAATTCFTLLALGSVVKDYGRDALNRFRAKRAAKKAEDS